MTRIPHKRERERAILRVTASKKFQRYLFKGARSRFSDAPDPMQKHFTCAELAKMWGVSVNTIRRVFEQESGVLKFGHGHRRMKRAYVTFRIPEEVARRVHRKLTS